jgi:HD-GYP domain-containing protein (c-di-GMP phosphodiesterase class II)
LTPEEYESIKLHPTMGAIIVSSVKGFEEALPAVQYHHERWDGQGYPDGLAGEEIPLVARILAVADAFSAMTTDRPYRKGMSSKIALQILEEGAGTQWDADLVSAFVALRRRKAA